MLSLSGISTARIAVIAGAAIIIGTLFLMLQAAQARAAQMEERADRLYASYQAERQERIEAEEKAQEFEQALIERSKRLERVRKNTEDLRSNLRAVREHADEQYNDCMELAAPSDYIDRMRTYLHGVAREPE